jgi:pSer/pThr/pTyr-binding forkhead associated (FHA) protein
VTIGHHPKCGFVLEQPGILDQHAQIFYAQGKYWVKDLTGQALVQVNHQVVDAQTLLQVNDLISLGPRGPVFRFVGEGRLAEAEEQTNESSAQSGPGTPAAAGAKPDAAGAPSPKGGLFSKMRKKKLF